MGNQKHRNALSLRTLALAFSAVLFCGACGDDDDGVDSDEEARRAYLGLDLSIEKSLQLGFDGFNAASNANIPPQMTTGDETGTLTISGQVDQGASDNKEMRLWVGMVEYSDGVIVVEEDGEEIEIDITYDTSDVEMERPYLQLSLRDVPDGTFTGTLTGTYFLFGDIEGEATVNLMMSGEIEAGPNDTVIRTPGTTTVTGEVTSGGDGVYEVNLTI